MSNKPESDDQLLARVDMHAAEAACVARVAFEKRGFTLTTGSLTLEHLTKACCAMQELHNRLRGVRPHKPEYNKPD